MSDANFQNYSQIGYNNLLQTSDGLSFPLGYNVVNPLAAYGANSVSLPNPTVAGPTDVGSTNEVTVKTEGALDDVFINNFIQSVNWKPKNQGFYINGQTGYAEFSSVYVNGTIIASVGIIGGWTINATSLSSSGIILDSTGSIASIPFVSGPLGVGWSINGNGTAEFQNVIVRGSIRTSVFEKDTISAVNGMVLVSSADSLASDMTALDSSTLTISGQTTFSANEVLRIKDGTDDEWMLVTSAASAPTYTVTRDLAGSYAPNTNPVWKKGTAVVSTGVGSGTKTGFILMDSSSSNSPYIDIYGRLSTTYNDYGQATTHLPNVRVGWLKGIVDTDVGLNNTDVWGIYTINGYFKGTIFGSTIIGGTVETSSGTGQRIVIESVNNTLSFYNSSNNVVAQLGGGANISQAIRITNDSSTTDGVAVASSVANGVGYRYTNDSNVANIAFVISQQGTTNNTNPCIQIERAGSGDGIFLDHDGTGRGILIDSASGTSFPLEILNAGTANSIDIEDSGGATSIVINNSTSTISNFGIDMTVTSNTGAPVGIRFNITRGVGGNSYAFQFAGPEFASSGFAGSVFRKVRVLFPSGNVGYIYCYDG